MGEMTLGRALAIAFASWYHGEPLETDVMMALSEHGYTEDVVFEQFDNGLTPDDLV